ncbi:hypothetical protein ABPG74_018503 [Tetrahymena malaccensis]
MLNLLKELTPTIIDVQTSKLQRVFEKDRNLIDIQQYFNNLADCSNLLELTIVIRIVSYEHNSLLGDLFLNLPNLTSFLIQYPKLQQNDSFLIGKALSKMALLKQLRIQKRQQIKNEEIKDISQAIYQLPSLKEIWFDFILSYTQKDLLENIFEALSQSRLLVIIRLYLKMNDQNSDHKISQLNQINQLPNHDQPPNKKFGHLCRLENLRIFSIFTNMNHQEVFEEGFQNFIKNCSSLRYLKLDVSIEDEDINIFPKNSEPNTNLKELSLDLCISQKIQEQSKIKQNI